MGRAARANPLALTPGKDEMDVAAARMIRGCAEFIKTPEDFEKVLERFAAGEEREAVRRYLRPHITFDIDKIRQQDEEHFHVVRRNATMPPAALAAMAAAMMHPQAALYGAPRTRARRRR